MTPEQTRDTAIGIAIGISDAVHEQAYEAYDAAVRSLKEHLDATCIAASEAAVSKIADAWTAYWDQVRKAEEKLERADLSDEMGQKEHTHDKESIVRSATEYRPRLAERTPEIR